MSIAANLAIQPKCAGRLFTRLGNDGHAEPAADHLGDRLERHAFVVDRMIGAVLDALFEREPVEAGGIEPMHAGPAVAAVADIGRDAFLAREADQARDETMIAVAMGRRRQPHRGYAHAPCRDGGGRSLRGAREIGRGLVGSVAIRPGASNASPEVTSIGRADPSRTAPIASIARRSSAQFSANFEKSWLKAVWMTASALRAPSRRLSEIFERAAMDLGAHGCERLRSGIGAGEAQYLMA